ncbi:MAG: hypothetical protein GXP55_09975 [Deltaproteobacteria bacterium]|nr:hypothetical protein [Deltaproteobacteria bacterium]
MTSAQNLERRLGRLRLGARALLGLRALWVSAAVSFAAFSVAAVAVGKSAGGPALASAWTLISLSGVLALGLAARPLRGLRGAGAARLLASRYPALAMRVRSAAELVVDRPGSSKALVEAHVDAAWRELNAVHPRRVMPVGALWRWDMLMSVAALGLALGMMTLAERATQGTFTLLHPGAHSTDGVSLGVVFQSLELRVAYPHYMRRPPVTLEAGETLSLPPGSSVSVLAQGSPELREARMHTPRGAVALRAEGHGRFRGRFVLRSSGVLSIRATEGDGVWVEDARRTRLELRADQPPQISLLAPEVDAIVPVAGFRVAFDARDDVGVARVEVCVRGPAGDVHRERLWHASTTGADRRRRQGERELDLSSLQTQPGDVLSVWLEAWDADDVSGPHHVQTPPRHVTLASAHSQRLEAIASLEQLRGRLTLHLADRLEQLDTPAILGERLVDLSDELSRARSPSASETSLLHALASHLGTLGRSEAAARGDHALTRAGRRARAGVEEDLLSLDDLLTEARLTDAAQLARELEALRREMVSLVSQLRDAPNEQTRRALEAALGRARSRLRELSARLSARMGAGSGEFLNRGEARTGPTEDALAQLEAALERGDLDAMDRSLVRFEARIDALSRALGGAQEAFGAGRFGPRQAALAEAMDRLSGLEAEQRSISAAADRVRRQAAEHALEGGAQAELRPGLLDKGRRAREALAEIPRGDMAASERRQLERAQTQLRDTLDALRAGDLAQAREQARATRNSVEALARDLDLSELMGGAGAASASARARAGREAEAQLGELSGAIDRAIPNLRHHLDERMRESLRDSATRQARAAEAADTLAGLFETGPDGRPLSQHAQREVEAAREQMRRAEHAFARPDPIAAGEDSARAASGLSSLRRELEQEQREPSESRGQRSAERVRIHGREEAGSPSERRRRAMSALRQSPPPGYEDALREYYGGLLR